MAETPPSAPSGRARPVEVLLVEDNPGDVRLTREALKESKVWINLRVAETGERALRMLRDADSAEPHLLLLDLNLPGMSGFEVLEEIRDDEGLRRTPVVILTSSEAEEDIARGYDLNVNAFVTKPVDLDGLMEVVNAIDEFWFTVVRLPARGG